MLLTSHHITNHLSLLNMFLMQTAPWGHASCSPVTSSYTVWHHHTLWMCSTPQRWKITPAGSIQALFIKNKNTPFDKKQYQHGGRRGDGATAGAGGSGRWGGLRWRTSATFTVLRWAEGEDVWGENLKIFWWKFWTVKGSVPKKHLNLKTTSLPFYQLWTRKRFLASS